jgi:NAD(P)-dependent dehydrogenase (short-subunit alcohol dehydrogenase family)
MPDQQKYVNKLQGKHVLILGGSAGIGYGVAEACLEYGSKVFISSSNEQRIQVAVAKLQNAYPSKKGNIKGLACDLSGEDVENKLVELLQKVGDINHIVFTAGDQLATMPIQDMELASLKKAGQIRYFAPLLLAKHLPKSTQSYTITSGGIAFKPIKDWSAVAGYASALHAMTRNLALDLAPVRVNLISPGAVDTDLWQNLSEDEKRKFFEAIEKNLLTGRVGRVEDVVEGYLAFMRDENCTGTIYTTDGGHILI